MSRRFTALEASMQTITPPYIAAVKFYWYQRLEKPKNLLHYTDKLHHIKLDEGIPSHRQESNQTHTISGIYTDSIGRC